MSWWTIWINSSAILSVSLWKKIPFLILHPLPPHCEFFHLLSELLHLILQRWKSTSLFGNLVLALSLPPSHRWWPGSCREHFHYVDVLQLQRKPATFSSYYNNKCSSGSFLTNQLAVYYSEHDWWSLKNKYLIASNRHGEINNATIIICNKGIYIEPTWFSEWRNMFHALDSSQSRLVLLRRTFSVIWNLCLNLCLLLCLRSPVITCIFGWACLWIVRK